MSIGPAPPRLPACPHRTHTLHWRQSEYADPYIITSLTAAEAGPERLLEMSRKHWASENQLHYVRDVSFNEDRCRVHAGARALAAIGNLVPHLIRSRGMSVPEARGNFREDREEAIAVVIGRIL